MQGPPRKLSLFLFLDDFFLSIHRVIRALDNRNNLSACRKSTAMLETTRLLADLVALPSLNPMGRLVSGEQWYEYRVTDYLEHFFRELGVPHERQPVAPRRENIVAHWQAPGAKKTLLLEVHQD